MKRILLVGIAIGVFGYVSESMAVTNCRSEAFGICTQCITGYRPSMDRRSCIASPHCTSGNGKGCYTCEDGWVPIDGECVSEEEAAQETTETPDSEDCDGGFELVDGECVGKLRYTLPEADAATSNDNENMIEWIFE